MPNFCLLPTEVDKFLGALKSGKIDPSKLSKMTSEQRHKFFSEIAGEPNAKGVNSLFESKLLLKNQQRGYITWAKTVSGLKPEIRRDLISRIEKMDKFLSPAEQDQFLKDLASTRLGFDVTREEAQTIAKMSKNIEDTKAKMKPDFTFSNDGERLDYGRSLVALRNYVDEFKVEANKLTGRDFRKNPLGSGVKAVSNLAGLGKAMLSSLDNSALGRQGLKVMLTHPTVWSKNALKSFVDIARSFGGKEVIDETLAEVLSRPNALKGIYRKEKIDLGNTEEAYPTSLPEKVKYVGAPFKASQAAFTSFQYRNRADLMDLYVDLAKRTGGDYKGMGIVANGLTGRGRIGGLEKASKTVNNVFFSPRLLKSNIDALTAHITDYGELGTMARKEAAKNTVKIISGIAAILAMAHAINPDSVEFDPRSSNFGKIKIGDTRFDVSGGMSSLVTLASREIKGSTKSGSGIISKLNAGYGSQTGTGVFWNFLGGKFSPAAGIVRDWANKKDMQGNPITPQGEVSHLLMPLPITNYLELKNDPNSANKLVAILADALGVSTNTYGQSQKNWKVAPTPAQQQFLQKVGQSKFDEANQVYNREVDAWNKANLPSLQDQSDTIQQKMTAKAHTDIQNKVYKKYGFKPPKDKKTPKSLFDKYQYSGNP